MPTFLIVTTNNLPESYFLAEFLLEKKQSVGLLSIRGRTLSQKLKVFNRMRKKRGWFYLADLTLGKLTRSHYQDPAIIPFPHLTGERIAELQKELHHSECDDPHSSRTLEIVREFAPDYILVAGAPVLKESLFGLAKICALNRHLGLAPEYRGSDCPIWAISHNRFDRTGLTIHVVAKKVDGGNIMLQRQVQPQKFMNFSEFLAHMNRQGSEGYVQVLDRIISSGPFTGEIQPSGGEHYPPAGWTTIRRAWRNWQKFTQSPKS